MTLIEELEQAAKRAEAEAARLQHQDAIRPSISAMNQAANSRLEAARLRKRMEHVRHLADNMVNVADEYTDSERGLFKHIVGDL